MYFLLHQYLVDKRHLSLPEIGTWQLHEEPAKYDHTTQQLVGKKVVVDFNTDLENAKAIQPLIGYIAKSSGEPEEDCYEQLNEFTEKLKNSLDNTGSFDWPGLGTLHVAQDSGLSFEPDAQLEKYTPTLAAPRIVHAGKVHQMLVGDHETDTGTMQNYLHEAEVEEEEMPVAKSTWWIPALIAGILGIALIVARLNKWI